MDAKQDAEVGTTCQRKNSRTGYGDIPVLKDVGLIQVSEPALKNAPHTEFALRFVLTFQYTPL